MLRKSKNSKVSSPLVKLTGKRPAKAPLVSSVSPKAKKPLPPPAQRIIPKPDGVSKLESLKTLVGNKDYLFVVYTEKTGPSGRALTEALRGVVGSEAVGGGTPDMLERLIRALNKQPKYVINVGVAGRINTTAPVTNRTEAVAHSSNKRLARISFRDGEVAAPELWLSAAGIPAKAFPVVGRTTNHTKAHGFWYCKTKEEATSAEQAGATHFLKFIPNTREFRLHLMVSNLSGDRNPEDYVSIKLSEKMLDPDATKHSDIIKNHDNGWVFKFPADTSGSVFSKARDVAKKAMAAIKLDWGAVDVIYDLDSKEALVLEINTSPCLTDDTANTVDKYASGLMRLVGGGGIPKKARAEAAPEVAPRARGVRAPTSDRDRVRALVKRVGL